MAQGWSNEELTQAGTAAGCPYLTGEEKEVYKYTNLARMYPAKFARLEVPSSGDWYVETLREELLSREPVGPLCPDPDMYEYARCFAEEQSKSGLIGHERYTCPKMENCYSGENIDYGNSTGKAIVLNLLIDRNVSNLGHRQNCLNPNYNALGVSINSHPQYRLCCVMDFAKKKTAPNAYRVTTPSVNHVDSSEESTTTSSDKIVTTNVIINSNSNNTINSRPNNTGYSSSYSANQGGTKNKVRETETKGRLKDRFYEKSGKSFLSILSLGYNYSFLGENHRAEVGVLDFRYTFFGMSPLNFEMQLNPVSTWFAYRPSVHGYIPCLSWLAVKLYAGVETDITYLGQYLIKGYKFDYDKNYFLSAFGGASLVFIPHKCVPMEIMVEYQHQIINQVKSNGFYLSIRFNFGIGKN